MITSKWTIKSWSIFTCSNYATWSKLTIKASEQRQHCYLGISIAELEQVNGSTVW